MFQPKGRALLLIGHGTVDDLGDLEAFVTNIRRGRPPSEELMLELRKRYQAIGGVSPLKATSQRLAERVGEVLGVPTRLAQRMWHPYADEALRELLASRATAIDVLALAQFSSAVYGDTVRRALGGLGDLAAKVELSIVPDWGEHPAYVRCAGERLARAVARIPAEERRTTRVVLTAHSLPVNVIRSGDPYETRFRASAEAIAGSVDLAGASYVVAFQSQGDVSGPWLGPDLETTLDQAKADGMRRIVFAPVGFLADHVEILYDLDIEAKGWCEARGLGYARTASLNDDDDFAHALAEIVREASAEQAP